MHHIFWMTLLLITSVNTNTNSLQALESASEAPRETVISGVTFHRSKNGNKYFRQDKFDQKQMEKYSDTQYRRDLLSDHLPRKLKPQKSAQLCAKFHTTGTFLPALPLPARWARQHHGTHLCFMPRFEHYGLRSHFLTCLDILKDSGEL
jgi:hypothetical protein